MNKIYGAYLEDYHYIKIIVPSFETYNINNIWLTNNKEKIQLNVFKSERFGQEYHLHTSFKGIISLHSDYLVNVDGKVSFNLCLGKISKTARFEFENYYDGPLGCEYNKDYSVFRVWTPVAKSLELILVHKDNTEEPFYPEYLSNGVWQIKIDGDLEGYGYYYRVRVNTHLHKVVDPYGISTNRYGNMSYVINPNKLYSFKQRYFRPGRSFDYVDAVIMEASVKDFTYTLPVKHPGTFKGLVETKDLEHVGLNHLVDLGITHLQLMPVYTFGGVDEENPDKLYNWGYNPVQYNVPSGLYTTDLDDPYTRINELRELVDTIHGMNMGINIDVVYNHVYDSQKFAYSVLVPGYFFHDDNQGYMTNVSGCGNDFASNKRMARRYIIESVLYWQSMYHIDGFRFDLMGLLDTDTMNEITNLVKTINPYAMIYGEGWNMPSFMDDENKAMIYNASKLKNIGFFNDYYRESLKYDYVGMNVIKGNYVSDYKKYFGPTQSINYLECHDNYTYYDLQKYIELRDEKFAIKRQTFKIF